MRQYTYLFQSNAISREFPRSPFQCSVLSSFLGIMAELGDVRVPVKNRKP